MLTDEEIWSKRGICLVPGHAINLIGQKKRSMLRSSERCDSLQHPLHEFFFWVRVTVSAVDLLERKGCLGESKPECLVLPPKQLTSVPLSRKLPMTTQPKR